MMENFRWIISIVLLLISTITILGNLGILVSGLLKKGENSISFIPIIGGVSGCIGFLILPWGDWKLCLLPVIFDFPTIFIIVHFGWQLLTKGRLE